MICKLLLRCISMALLSRAVSSGRAPSSAAFSGVQMKILR
jgi:hypothetical protein